MSDALLSVSSLEASYGDARALFGVSLEVNAGETLALIGANRAGKSTLLKSICGLVQHKQGKIVFKSEDITNLRPSEIVKRGIALVPEGRRLFPSLSVEENLLVGGNVERPGPWNIGTVFGLFPTLQELRRRPSTHLSGGQQQMLAIGRALMSNPELILFDELSLGLAPVVIDVIYHMLPSISSCGLAAILVEQDVTRALGFASRFICLQEGLVSLSGTPKEHSREEITKAYFGT